MKNIKGLIYELTETFIASIVIILVIYTFVASVEVVWGTSMEPNFHTGERILIDKITSKLDGYRKGDVVVVIPPGDDSKHFLKRVIGLPGDLFKIYDCKVFIGENGKKYELDEPYLEKDLCTVGGTVIQDGRAIIIPPNQYLVLGDNRAYSVDSRYIGLIDKGKIVGRVIFKLWPPQDVGFVNW